MIELFTLVSVIASFLIVGYVIFFKNRKEKYYVWVVRNLHGNWKRIRKKRVPLTLKFFTYKKATYNIDMENNSLSYRNKCIYLLEYEKAQKTLKDVKTAEKDFKTKRMYQFKIREKAEKLKDAKNPEAHALERKLILAEITKDNPMSPRVLYEYMNERVIKDLGTDLTSDEKKLNWGMMFISAIAGLGLGFVVCLFYLGVI